MKHWMVGVFWMAGALLSACSSAGPGATSDAAANDTLDALASGDATAGDDAAASGALLCDGSDSVRLAYRLAGGGPAPPGSQVLSENGFVYLIITGTCHYWVLAEIESEVREGTLSADQAASLAADLGLERWSELPPKQPGGGCADGPTPTVRFRGDRYELPGCTFPAPDGGAALALESALAAVVKALYLTGAPASGSVRFVLTRPQFDWGSAVEAQAVAWPQAAPDAASVAMTTEQIFSYRSGSSALATEAAAVALRAIRTMFGGNVRPLSDGALPVVDRDGTAYLLYLRDSIPLEDDHGLLDVF